jgi:ATP-dependent DNA helicase RecG
MDLSTQISFIKGIGEKRGAVLNELGIVTVENLLHHFPRRYLDRSNILTISKIRIDENVTIVGRVTGHQVKRGRKGRSWLDVVIADETGFLTCRWFHGVQWLQKRFEKDMTIAVSGKVEFFGGFQILHPDFDILSDDTSNPINTGIIVPLYPSTHALQKMGFDSRGFRRILKPIIDANIDKIVDYFSAEFLTKNQLISLNDAIHSIHFPESEEGLQAAQRRLKFDELFFLQLVLAVRKQHFADREKQHQYASTGEILAQQYKRITFKLTHAQERVVREIWDDLKSPHPMNRLLQGDVGSGKTVVSFLAVAIVVGNGYQAALMAPTEILAEQHYKSAIEFFKGSDIRPVLITGSLTAAQKRDTNIALKNGYFHLAIGTHALIQSKVTFKNLRFVIIDEQHRFGVMQRGALLKKGEDVDILVMTATPIPRTLSMTLYGDLSSSIIDELPANRQPIITRKVDPNALDKVYGYARDQLDKGRQVFVVYPLIEDSEKMDLKAATQGFDTLSHVFSPYKVVLLHGRMSAIEKEEIMNLFSQNRIQVLVSTTVIEVGIDIPNATLMIIENAERFGLAQLHQLRGRIGRGEHRSVCVLVERKPTEDSQFRLGVMTTTTDGFVIAEEDLKLRGSGDIFGTKQHGLPQLKIANLLFDRDLLFEARKVAFDMIKQDPHLRKEHHQRLRENFLKDYSDTVEMVSIS